jgi:predicted O-methyltransferase YrrM
VQPGIRKGRSPSEGFNRGWGLEYGDLRDKIEADPDFRHAASFAEQRTLGSPDRFKNLFLLITQYLPALPPGNIIEFGTYRGGTAFFMGALAAKFLPETLVYALDSFAGMPPVDPAIDVHRQGDFQTDFAEVVYNRDRFGLRNVKLIRGLFMETASQVLAEASHIRLAHIDCDIYDAVRYSYEVCKPFMVPGGYIVFDDSTTSSCPGATEAVEETPA